jgi:hypothetical protein
MTHWSDVLEDYWPCEDGLAWARTQPTYRAAWNACDKVEWVVWWLGVHSDTGATWRLTLARARHRARGYGRRVVCDDFRAIIAPPSLPEVSA